MQTEADVTCPHCGEAVTIGLDPDGGASQEYVEDCQVCCRPWVVRVRYDHRGDATVTLDPA
jgi:Cysteine-rich CPXCG